MGGHLNPLSFTEYTGRLISLHEGLCVECVTWWCVETTDTLGVGYVGATCDRVHERHAGEE